MKLVIVESPTKCNTIQKYLGSEYKVLASKGHIRDLSTRGKGGLGVDIDNDFKADYVIDKKKYLTVNELKKAKKEAKEVYLATDPDREGEAISWHLCEVLGLDEEKVTRLEFHEITKPAILKAIENPRHLDIDLVNSQEARRIIDRIMGFDLSKLMKRKTGGEAAGRVQSVTLKLITDREREISSFIKKEYWAIYLTLDNGLKIKLDSSLDHNPILNEEEADRILNDLEDQVKVFDIVTKNRRVEPKAPFTTSTLQQEAFRKLHFSTSKTQKIAQDLYEGVSLKDETVGLITYMRTDSIRLSPEFVSKAKDFIEEKFGKEYVGSGIHTNKNNQLVQDAHEAIRPTSVKYEPSKIKEYLTPDQYKLYKLIYDRALSSLMTPKMEEVTSVKFFNKNYVFKTEGVRTTFDGFTKLYGIEEKDNGLPELEKGQIIKVVDKEKEQKFTTPPARFNEGRLVKAMEESGIGRPSTYATTISNLEKHRYIAKNENKEIIPTQLAYIIVDKLVEFFPDFMDIDYTSKMETQLDEIAGKQVDELSLLKDFYKKFKDYYDNAVNMMEKQIDYAEGSCPDCGSPLVYKESKFGRFIACSNYPKCRYIKKEEKEEAPEVRYTGENCPECGKPLIFKKKNTKFKFKGNNEFIACSGFPNCKFTKSIGEETKPVEKPIITDKMCPKCGKPLLLRKGVRGKSDFYGCSGYPKCRYSEVKKD